MSGTPIEWTDRTWNPLRGLAPDRWLCRKVSPGCDNCYADRLNHRWGGQHYFEAGTKDAAVLAGLTLDERTLDKPNHWGQPAKVFVCDMTDLFGEWVPDEWINRVMAVIEGNPHLTFQVLTKRAKRMQAYFADYLTDRAQWSIPNLWLGVSVESQAYAWRINALEEIPAAVRFISAEPLLGPLDLRIYGASFDWLIVGGESGPAHRPIDPDWVRSLRARCQEVDVPFFFKQWGGPKPKAGGRLLDGVEWSEYPGAIVFREYEKATP